MELSSAIFHCDMNLVWSNLFCLFYFTDLNFSISYIRYNLCNSGTQLTVLESGYVFMYKGCKELVQEQILLGH